MTALPGAGAFPGIAGMPSGEEGAEEGDDPLPLSLSCCEKGSLLANRLKEASWPSCTVVMPEASELDPGVGVVAGLCEAPWSVGAASEGVPVGAGVVELAGRGGADGCSRFITRGTWNTSSPRK